MKNLNSFEGKEITLVEQNQVEGGLTLPTGVTSFLSTGLTTIKSFLSKIPVIGATLSSGLTSLLGLFGIK